MTTVTQLPASIRHKNPGAMGLGSSAKLFGATKNTTLGDGNSIATFPTSVDGAGAMFHLLRSKTYLGLSIWNALHKWGDGQTLELKGEREKGTQRTDGYAATIERYTAFSRHDRVSADWLENPDKAIEFGKAMARHEAGGEYPMTEAQWREAHAEFMTQMRGGVVLVDRVKPEAVTAPLALLITHIGERRVPGPANNDFIALALLTISGRALADETAHCAAVLGRMLKETGYAYIDGDAGLLARNYLKYGHALDEPEQGAIVIFWRNKPDSWEGHVAFVESWTATTLTVVGANQRDRETGETGKVCRMTVPRIGPKSQVLGYRRPVLATRPAAEVLADKSIGQKAVGGIGALSALIWSAWGGISGAASAIVHVVGDMVGLLPETASHVGTTVAAGQQLSEAAGVPWPIQIGLLVTVCSLAFGAYQSWKRLRPSKGELTRPPYETDETPIAGDDVEDVFANVVSLDEERAKREPKLARAETIDGPAPELAEVSIAGSDGGRVGLVDQTRGGVVITIDGKPFNRAEIEALVRNLEAATPAKKPAKPKAKAKRAAARKPGKRRAA